MRGRTFLQLRRRGDKMKASPLLRIVSLCVVLTALVVPAWPQASTGSVSGTVRDATAAVIPGATVALVNQATSVASKSTTNEVGFYIFPGVIPGPYRLTVEANGMQKFEGSLTVLVQQSAVVDVSMKVGQTSTEVAVKDVTPLVQVDNPTLGGTLERTRIEQLPLNGRNVMNLLQTVPGQEGTGRAFGIRESSFEAVLDGAALADRLNYGNSGATGARITYRQPGLDSIQNSRWRTTTLRPNFPGRPPSS
jgi:hypothetical protein